MNPLLMKAISALSCWFTMGKYHETTLHRFWISYQQATGVQGCCGFSDAQLTRVSRWRTSSCSSSAATAEPAPLVSHFNVLVVCLSRQSWGSRLRVSSSSLLWHIIQLSLSLRIRSNKDITLCKILKGIAELYMEREREISSSENPHSELLAARK